MAPVHFDVDDHVAVITLDRPEKRNAINGEMARGIEAAIDTIEGASDIRVGILRATTNGDRPVFCSGRDLTTLGTGDDPNTERGGFAGLTARERTKPLIAAVDGLATSGGWELALACDIVVAARRASFALAEVKWNLFAAGGGVFRLPRVAGRHAAMDILLTGEAISAERAHQLGLVSRLTDDGQVDTVAMHVARTIAANAPVAVGISRRIAAAAEFIDDEDAWRLVRDARSSIDGSADLEEGVRAFTERRTAVWTGR